MIEIKIDDETQIICRSPRDLVPVSIKVNPQKVLEALEEQAPEVLREWLVKQWRKVEDEPPPKDGNFLGRTIDPIGHICYVGVVFQDSAHSNHYREVWSGRLLGINEWTPIPGGE